MPPRDAGVRPNFLILWNMDVSPTHLDCYGQEPGSRRTPNVDRLAREGMRFTGWYAGPHTLMTCDAEAVAPPSPTRLPAPALATLLRPLGYATGQFGNCHLDGLDALLPALHGFDEFFGSLSVPTADEIHGRDAWRGGEYGPLHCWADGNGNPRIETGRPLVGGRQTGAEGEALDAAIDFIVRQNIARRPFFVWYNSSGSQVGGDRAAPSAPKLDHDRLLGGLLDQLDHLGLADETLVMYSSPARPMSPPHLARTRPHSCLCPASYAGQDESLEAWLHTTSAATPM